jgi:carbohydrate-selective porin OprB
MGRGGPAGERDKSRQAMSDAYRHLQQAEDHRRDERDRLLVEVARAIVSSNEAVMHAVRELGERLR